MSFPVKVLKDGLLEKRSSGLLQLWKKKRCVLTEEEGLRLHDCKGGDAPSPAWSSKAKELLFERMSKVDCVEYKRGVEYFTVVMASGQEIDFRCPQDRSGGSWNTDISMALMRFKNKQAMQASRKRHLHTAHLGSTGEDEEL
ncbi:pleckstrin homology-like domain family A member 3 [Austrofundulus limnaeus]|uniref:Pleckstrin homology-like domain family A member 3 n=1 Tax=Austrofundulus limnaeus TaxID=52670 RepID=A0A2I4C0E2_AUSLI|nr:PREDICTED: pleckstrin homology-like domain family A member 3 [Austrofundulus limnaeus]